MAMISDEVLRDLRALYSAALRVVEKSRLFGNDNALVNRFDLAMLSKAVAKLKESNPYDKSGKKKG